MSEIREVDDFESVEEKVNSDMSLKAALLHIESELGLNANEYFDLGHTQSHIQHGNRSYFAGWSYLGDGGKRTMATTTVQKDGDDR